MVAVLGSVDGGDLMAGPQPRDLIGLVGIGRRGGSVSRSIPCLHLRADNDLVSNQSRSSTNEIDRSKQL
jgi:hypothetical protein